MSSRATGASSCSFQWMYREGWVSKRTGASGVVAVCSMLFDASRAIIALSRIIVR
jgi:hypothetical protein